MEIERLWKKGNLKIPKIVIAENAKSGETYLVIEDDSTIYKLINKTGQIYVVAGFRCKVLINERNERYYSVAIAASDFR